MHLIDDRRTQLPDDHAFRFSSGVGEEADLKDIDMRPSFLHMETARGVENRRLNLKHSASVKPNSALAD